MRKNFGAKHLILPQPVYILGTYNEDGTPKLPKRTKKQKEVA